MMERLTLVRVRGGDARWRDDVVKREDKVRVVGKRREAGVGGRVIRESGAGSTLSLCRSLGGITPSVLLQLSHFQI